jgi:hypothetical protein
VRGVTQPVTEPFDGRPFQLFGQALSRLIIDGLSGSRIVAREKERDGVHRRRGQVLRCNTWRLDAMPLSGIDPRRPGSRNACDKRLMQVARMLHCKT